MVVQVGGFEVVLDTTLKVDVSGMSNIVYALSFTQNGQSSRAIFRPVTGIPGVKVPDVGETTTVSVGDAVSVTLTVSVTAVSGPMGVPVGALPSGTNV